MPTPARSTSGSAHPLAGPVYVKGAEPGQVLEVEFVAYESADFGVTGVIPGFGFLADLFTEPYVVKWEIADGIARSAELPGVAVPEELFAGVVGVAPSHERLRAVLEREERLRAQGQPVADSLPEAAVPPEAAEGLRTIPPRETRREPGRPPARAPAAGSGCRSTSRARSSRPATSTSRRATARSAGRRSRSPAPSPSASRSTTARRRRCRATRRPRGRSRRSFATMGIPVETGMDLNAAARAALLEMIDHLEQRYGFERPAAYALASVAVDLRVSEVVDVPYPLVSALLRLDVFEPLVREPVERRGQDADRGDGVLDRGELLGRVAAAVLAAGEHHRRLRDPARCSACRGRRRCASGGMGSPRSAAACSSAATTAGSEGEAGRSSGFVQEICRPRRSAISRISCSCRACWASTVRWSGWRESSVNVTLSGHGGGQIRLDVHPTDRGHGRRAALERDADHGGDDLGEARHRVETSLHRPGAGVVGAAGELDRRSGGCAVIASTMPTGSPSASRIGPCSMCTSIHVSRSSRLASGIRSGSSPTAAHRLPDRDAVAVADPLRLVRRDRADDRPRAPEVGRVEAARLLLAQRHRLERAAGRAELLAQRAQRDQRGDRRRARRRSARPASASRCATRSRSPGRPRSRRASPTRCRPRRGALRAPPPPSRRRRGPGRRPTPASTTVRQTPVSPYAPWRASSSRSRSTRPASTSITGV